MDLLRLFNHGALPAHYLVDDPAPLLKAYVNAYIKEEIIDEAATRNIPAFSRFLSVVGLTHGQQLNYANVARETHVSAATVRSYFQILDDTLLGFTLEPWSRAKKRRLVETAKFYLFDIGVANQLNPEDERNRRRIRPLRTGVRALPAERGPRLSGLPRAGSLPGFLADECRS